MEADFSWHKKAPGGTRGLGDCEDLTSTERSATWVRGMRDGTRPSGTGTIKARPVPCRCVGPFRP